MRPAAALLILVALSGCARLEDPLAKDLAAEDRWGDVQAQAERRRALAGKLVAAAKAAPARDEGAVAAAAEARARANLHMTQEDLRDSLKVEAFVRAQDRLRAALDPLAGAAEKADLATLDEGLARALRAYDEAARAYDEAIAGLPRTRVNQLTGRRWSPRARLADPAR